MGNDPAQTAQGRWGQLQTGRSPYLRRAEDCANLTIPSLLPAEGSSGSTEFVTPYQAFGARGVNNLASKLLLALLPPNQSFFRMVVNEFVADQIAGSPDLKGEIEKALGKVERSANTEIETSTVRVSVFEGLKQLIATGNTLLYLEPKGGLKVFSLRHYVVKRGPSGEVLEIIVKEAVSDVELSPAARSVVGDTKDAAKRSVDNTHDLYTWIRLEGNFYTAWQEIKGKRVPNTFGAYPKDQTPWLPLRWTKVDGEDYGRGHAEEYFGDLRSLEGLSKALLEGSSAAAKVLILVKPNGTTDMRTVSEAENLAVRSGNAEDVTVVQLQKHADFTVAANQIAKLEARLGQAFLLTSSVQRQAERVTAEEIRLLAGELEDSLGGIYTLLSQEFQLPFIRRLLYQLTQAQRLPPLPPTVKPSITTGMAALGRGHDLQAIQMFAGVVNQILGPSGFAQVVKPNALIAKIGTALGISLDGLVKTDDEIAAQQQQQNQQQLIEKIGPEAIRSLGQQAQPPA